MKKEYGGVLGFGLEKLTLVMYCSILIVKCLLGLLV